MEPSPTTLSTSLQRLYSGLETNSGTQRASYAQRRHAVYNEIMNKRTNRKVIVSRNSMSIMVAWEPDGDDFRFSRSSPRLVNYDKRIVAAMITSGIGGRGEQRGVCLVCGKLVTGSGMYQLDPKPFKKHVEAKHV